MFEQFFDALGAVLNFMYTLVPAGIRGSLGFGFAIMGLTVLVMALITPLTIKSTKSMLLMQRMQPEMKRLQEKYKDDREKLNQELMAFYREHQINPLGGCLPLIAQMPVFIIMYRLMYGLTERQGGLGTGTGQLIAQQQMGEPLQPWILLDQNFAPAHLNPSTELYQALSQTNDMNFLGMDLSWSTAQAMSHSFVTAIPYIGLLAVMLATGLYQNRQLQARNKGSEVNPQQQMIMKVMPFFLPIFSYGFPAGLALYWCTQNFCRIGTNAYITRSLYRKEHAEDAAIETTGKETSSSKKSSSKKAVGTASKDESKDSDRGPGKSAKSQAAHSKKSGQSTNGTTSTASDSGSVNPRRSGERRRGSKTSKDT